MNALFLCGYYPEEYRTVFFDNSKKGYQFAAQNLQKAIIDGFKKNDVIIQVITFPFLSTFPLGYKKPIIDYGKIDENCRCVSFVNIPFLSSVFNTCKRDVFNWCKQYSDDQKKYIVVYSLSSNLMKVALAAKRRFKNVHISIIIPDLPEYMGINRVYKLLGMKSRDNKFIYENVAHFDSFTLLTGAMETRLLIKHKPYCVVEGIFNEDHSEIQFDKIFEKDTKVIFYSGALAERYGLTTLLNAFSSLANRDYRLIICGDGQAKEDVRRAAMKDQRIVFLGKVDYQKVISLQKQATLLVNPRTPEGEYTQYSFPSKTIEYFASGTPVLMYKLPGIPDEYFNYCYIIENNSQQSLAEKIDFILSIPASQREIIGIEASNFIKRNKNARQQVKKIIDVINK